jgi:hypothetical protein
LLGLTFLASECQPIAFNQLGQGARPDRPNLKIQI